MRRSLTFWIFIWSSLPVQALRAATQEVQPTIVLTGIENGLEEQTNFTCYGKIYAYIRFPKRESDAHVLESRWVSPAGKVAADSRTPVDFKPARSIAYVWFAFPESANLLGSPDPELEEDRLSFNGRWHLEVLWDEKPLLKKEFNVRCP